MRDAELVVINQLLDRRRKSINSIRAVVHHQAIDGEVDTRPENDFRPRSANPPFKTAPNPDGTINDKGVGKLKPDHTFGADIVTGVTVK
ncbi:MAG: hypothetical protein ABIP71_12200 [Verrucomicrobiota bacterium]